MTGTDTAQTSIGETRFASQTGFVRFATFVLLYTIFVVVWGAFVRATGSGAGCGSDWPLCHGEVVPRAPSVEKAIEFTHRATSGLAWLFAAALVGFARRALLSGAVRKAAYAVLFFMTTEALIGAGLVIFERVAGDTSLSRGYWISGHLVNTFALIVAATLCVDLARTPQVTETSWGRSVRGVVALGTFLFLGVGVSGAVAALGDTLFPVGSLIEGLRQDGDPRAHLWLRLRVWHPFFAVAFSAYTAACTVRALRVAPQQSSLANVSRWLLVLVCLQVLAGVVNLLLAAPIYMQLVHLLLSNVVLVTATLWSRRVLPRARVR